jgi:hypothetical protein
VYVEHASCVLFPPNISIDSYARCSPPLSLQLCPPSLPLPSPPLIRPSHAPPMRSPHSFRRNPFAEMRAEDESSSLLATSGAPSSIRIGGNSSAASESVTDIMKAIGTDNQSLAFGTSTTSTSEMAAIAKKGHGKACVSPGVATKGSGHGTRSSSGRRKTKSGSSYDL